MTASAHFESSFHSFTRLLDADFNFHREFRLLTSQRMSLKMENKNQQLEWLEPPEEPPDRLTCKSWETQSRVLTLLGICGRSSLKNPTEMRRGGGVHIKT